MPLCRTGPGGDYSRNIPGIDESICEARIQRGLSRLSKDLKLQVPLVSFGPDGVQYSKEGKELGSIVSRMLEVMHRIGLGDKNARIADNILVGNQIEAAERALEKIRAKPAGKNKLAPTVLKMAYGSLEDIAMPAGCDGRVTTDDAPETNICAGKETDPDGIDAEKDGDTPICPGVQETAWLFSNVGGNWKTHRSNKSNHLRSHKTSNKKRSSRKRTQTQRTLFADI